LIEDFKKYLKSKQERTALSPSGRHMGHYTVLLESIRHQDYELPNLIFDIAQLSLITAFPLHRWNKASQVMLEKGKGRYIENLWIIQLCEADLNFVLHTIWGHRLIWHATTSKALNEFQYALTGQTCNNAVLNKVLFLDFSWQTLSPGILTDYDATAALDRILMGLSIATCQQMGLPRITGKFMYLLLQNMEFNLMTGFGKSDTSYSNTDGDTTGQGVLQGSSSAAPIYILNLHVSLSTYKSLGCGASFIHPMSGN